MVLVQVPRVLTACARGYLKRWRMPTTTTTTSATKATQGEEAESNPVPVGLDRNNPHLYYSRAGLFDVDIYNHMNNAAYLTHAELARWEWSATTGFLDSQVKSQSAFVFGGVGSP